MPLPSPPPWARCSRDNGPGASCHLFGDGPRVHVQSAARPSLGKLAQVDMLLSAPPGNSATEAEPEVEEVEVSIGAGELATLIDRYSLLCFRDRPLSEERRRLNELGERELTRLPERF